MPTTVNIDQLCVSTLRFLSVDAVEAAKSGHPGLPLGAAPMAYALYDRILKVNPKNPNWANRDRFVLSAGHGSALLYSLLHCYGFGLPLDEVKKFRQMGSLTPGHPEYGHTVGVEATTGPLGQGISMAVGMALAERLLAAKYGDVVDHRTYTIVGDGDLMEGISSEAISLAGHLKLGKLTVLYDDNRISLDGPTSLSFTEDMETRFVAAGWQVLHVENGNDVDEIERQIRASFADPRPTMIRCHTNIGYGSPKQDSSHAHGSPLGPDATRATKEKLGWPLEPAFYVPEEAYTHFAQLAAKGTQAELDWNAKYDRWKSENPSLAAELEGILTNQLPADWASEADALDFGDKPIATRASASKVLTALANKVPALIGGAADLSESTKTNVEGQVDYQPEKTNGRNIYFGVREHAMGAAVNGMALSGLIAYSATFLVFSDYMRGAIRLGALMGIKSVYVFTHDSICVGEDGPTHEPVEHIAALRLIPGLTVLRPADAYESIEAWKLAVSLPGPKALILSRQNLPLLTAHRSTVQEGVAKGGHVLLEDANAKVTLLATGSEVALAMSAAAKLREQGVGARVVSLPSLELFRKQSADYRMQVLGNLPRVAIEAGVTSGWHEFTGDKGAIIGLDRFGLSAPGDAVYAQLGFTTERVVETALGLIGK